MIIMLHPKLSEHRRGRFFALQVDAVPMGEMLPDSGLLLMVGKDFQALDDSDRESYWQWCRSPGRTLLLLPSYTPGRLGEHCDWRLNYRSERPEPNGAVIADRLHDEVDYQLTGRDGEFDRAAGHQWPDFTVNTRYVKTYSASGVFAATCLPLWSIALMDESTALRDWLAELHRHAGEPNAGRGVDAATSTEPVLNPEDYGLMVCVHGWQTADAEQLIRTLNAQTVPIMDMNAEVVTASLDRLHAAGLLDAQGLSRYGLALLRSSPYWSYAVGLREESA